MYLKKFSIGIVRLPYDNFDRLVEVYINFFFFFREYGSSGSPSEGGEGGAQPELTPQQQHQQYLGDSRPELPPFPEIQWAGNPIPG